MEYYLKIRGPLILGPKAEKPFLTECPPSPWGEDSGVSMFTGFPQQWAARLYLILPMLVPGAARELRLQPER